MAYPAPVATSITVTADDPAVTIPVPEHQWPDQRVQLSVYESGGVVNIVSEATAAEGFTVPAVAAGDVNVLAGTYRLAAIQDGKLRAYATTPTSITFVLAYLPG